jgi:hypothetical protein
MLQIARTAPATNMSCDVGESVFAPALRTYGTWAIALLVLVPLPTRATRAADSESRVLRDITGIERTERQARPLLDSGAWLIIFPLVAGACLLWLIWRKHRSNVPRAQSGLFDELERLSVRPPFSSQETEPFYAALFQAIRQHPQVFGGVTGSARTTGEVLARIRDTGAIGPDEAKRLAEVLHRCDMARFGHADLPASDCPQDARLVEAILRRLSRPVQSQSSGESAKDWLSAEHGSDA